MKTYKQFTEITEGLTDYSNQGKDVRVPGEDTASFGKLVRDDLKQTGKFKNPKTGKLEGGMFPDPRKGYQLKQFATFRGGITRTMNPFLGKGQGALSGPTPLARQTPRLIRQGAKSLARRILSRGRLG